MADEVLSKLGFNVDDALGALTRLDTKLREVQSTFQQFGAALSAWNANTTGPVNVLTTIADNASRAASAMGRLNRAYAQALALPPSSVAAAIANGFSRATQTIIDSNLTTVIAAVILYQFGTGPVRGFAVTLTLGILASMFTAIFVSRIFFDAWLARRQPGTQPSI